MKKTLVSLFAFALLVWAGLVQAAGFERRDVTFPSQGLTCAAWYYVPAGLKPGETRPVIVMAHGYSGVKEQYLDNFASKFAGAGFVVLVFDYRYFGASEGEPRQQLLWYEQIIDYRNAITWVSMQSEVDANRLGVWGTSYSGGHVLQVAAFDKRVKAVVAQVPAVMPQQEAHEWLTEAAKIAPHWENRVTVESLEVGMYYDPANFISAVAPTPLLMVIASDDIITPTAVQKRAFERAREPKSLIVVPGQHFDPYVGPKHQQYVTPEVEWFERHLMLK